MNNIPPHIFYMYLMQLANRFTMGYKGLLSLEVYLIRTCKLYKLDPTQENRIKVLWDYIKWKGEHE